MNRPPARILAAALPLLFLGGCAMVRHYLMRPFVNHGHTRRGTPDYWAWS